MAKTASYPKPEVVYLKTPNQREASPPPAVPRKHFPETWIWAEMQLPTAAGARCAAIQQAFWAKKLMNGEIEVLIVECVVKIGMFLFYFFLRFAL